MLVAKYVFRGEGRREPSFCQGQVQDTFKGSPYMPIHQILSLYSYHGNLRHSSLSLNVPKLALLSKTILYILSLPMLHVLWLVLYFNQSNYAKNLGNASGISDPMQKVEFKGFAGIVEQTRGAFHKLQVNGATSN